MLLTTTRYLAGAATLVLLASCGGDAPTPPRPANEVTAQGGTVVAQSGAVALSFPAGAVSTPTTISVTPTVDPTSSANVVAGTVYDFGPDGSQFAQPVRLELKYDASRLPAGVPHAALRIAKYVDGDWKVIEESATMDSVSGKVSASIRSFSTYSVFVAPCYPFAVGVGATKGQLVRSDCVSSTNGHRSDYYNLKVAAGQVISIRTSATFRGVVGIKDQGPSDPRFGHAWLSTSLGGSMRLVSNGEWVQVYVTGEDSTQTGDYTITMDPPAGVQHSCSTDTYLMAGVSFYQFMSDGNSCQVTIKYGTVPEVNGKPIDTHVYGFRAEVGKSYRVTLSGLISSYGPTLTVFAGGGPIAQDGGPFGPSSREVAFTARHSGVHVIEVSSGTFTTTGSWITPAGSYTLRVAPY